MDLGNCPKRESLQKWLGEGAKGLFDSFQAQGAKVFQESFAPPKPSLAPVQPHFAPVQEASCSRGPKDLLQPLLATFRGNFVFRAISQVHSMPNIIAKRGATKAASQRSLDSRHLACCKELQQPTSPQAHRCRAPALEADTGPEAEAGSLSSAHTSCICCSDTKLLQN